MGLENLNCSTNLTNISYISVDNYSHVRDVPSVESHSLFEYTGTLLAVTFGATLMMHYFSKRDKIFQSKFQYQQRKIAKNQTQ